MSTLSNSISRSVKLCVWSICTLLTMSAPSFSEEGEMGVVDGNMLFNVCENPSDATQSFCSGYVIGVLEGSKFGAYMSYVRANESQGNEASGNAFVEFSLGFCAPENVEYGQIVDIFVKFLKENPEIRHRSARSLFVRSMSSAFIC